MYCGYPFEKTYTIWDKIYMDIPYRVREFIKPKTWSRMWRFFWQRRFRGFDDSELWSLDYTCAKLMAPRLRAFIDTWDCRSAPMSCFDNNSWPYSDQDFEDANVIWRRSLEKMYKAFKLIVDSDGTTYMLSTEEQAEIEEGLDLFREHFFELWD
jgi:hypothetical protein